MEESIRDSVGAIEVVCLKKSWEPSCHDVFSRTLNKLHTAFLVMTPFWCRFDVPKSWKVLSCISVTLKISSTISQQHQDLPWSWPHVYWRIVLVLQCCHDAISCQNIPKDHKTDLKYQGCAWKANHSAAATMVIGAWRFPCMFVRWVLWSESAWGNSSGHFKTWHVVDVHPVKMGKMMTKEDPKHP